MNQSVTKKKSCECCLLIILTLLVPFTSSGQANSRVANNSLEFDGANYPLLFGLEEKYLHDSKDRASLSVSTFSLADNEFSSKDMILNGTRTQHWQTDQPVTVHFYADFYAPVEEFRKAEFKFLSTDQSAPDSAGFYFMGGRLSVDDVIKNGRIDHDLGESRDITGGIITVTRMEDAKVKISFSLVVNHWRRNDRPELNNPRNVVGVFEGVFKVHQHTHEVP